jgi:mannonate dehydratase
MEETWRWYGPKDPITLSDIKQAGATGIVTALHQVPIGDVWTVEAITERKKLIEASGLRWSVVESVPVHESIKLGRSPDCERLLDNYKQSVRNLGKCGIKRLCYNFMPVIDWTRTDLEYEWSDGSRALAFDVDDFAAFELHLLCRPGAADSYSAAAKKRAAERFSNMSEAAKAALTKTVIAGLPGRMVEAHSLDDFQKCLDAYKTVDHAALRRNLKRFLEQVVPVAEASGVLMAIHPDDPPIPLLGIPRVVSTNADVEYLLSAVDSRANGICFCAGSYASSSVNEVEEMAEQHASRTHFVHLRNVRKGEGDSFVESDHLDGDVDMFRVVRTFMRELGRREVEGGWPDLSLPFRPDHGHKMLHELGSGVKTNPGYTAIGRLRGLAELRGLQEAISRVEAEKAGGGEAQLVCGAGRASKRARRGS